MKNLYPKLLEFLYEGEHIQLGTLLATVGSAPQVAGALAIFKGDTVLAGTLGGGLLEADAQKQASRSALEMQNAMRWIHFNAEMGDQVGAICGGSALYLMDANPDKHRSVFTQMTASLSNHRSGTLLSFIKKEPGQHLEIEKYWIEQKEPVPQHLESIVRDNDMDIQNCIDLRKSRYIESLRVEGQTDETFSVFVEPIHPVPRLIIAGAGHIGQALCHLSSLVDFEPVILDSRPELSVRERFPEAAQIICRPYAEAVNEIEISADTYIVIATQGHRTDMEVLKGFIQTDAAYIGVIGSTRKTILMGQTLLSEKTCTPDEWNFVHAPIGLDIHSKTVPEIAISILAELISERYALNFIRKRKQVGSIVLAAGKSTRMGQQKLLMPYQGKSVIRTIVDEIGASGSFQTWVVTGSHQDEIRENLKDCPLTFVSNENFEEGMLSSVKAGVNAMDAKTDGFLVFLGDQPMVSKVVINRLISVFRKTGKGLLIPTFGGKRGHPVLIDSKYKAELNAIRPTEGLRELFKNNPRDVLEIEVASEGILKDIDTPDDYRNAIEPKA